MQDRYINAYKFNSYIKGKHNISGVQKYNKIFENHNNYKDFFKNNHTLYFNDEYPFFAFTQITKITEMK